MKHLFAPSLLAPLVLQLPATAQEADARVLFQAVEPSVVSISNAEGGGSGIVLSGDGLILTNHHVVNAPLPLSVEALVEERGRTVMKSFANATLLKVHEQNDLALVKVDTAGAVLKPARISKSERDTVAGGVCYAMGFPFVPGQDKPMLTITKGIISSARRVVENNPYIQLDAAINPGNSGGALINERGVVIGIPTLKFEGVDRIGLAVPLAGLKMDQFVKAEEKKGNPQEAARLAGMASNLMLRDALSFGSDPQVLEMAIYLQREALVLEPNNPEWSLNMASMYSQLKKHALALAYAENAVRKDPNNLFSRSLLADLQELGGDPKMAIRNRLACLTIPPADNDKEQRKLVMEKLASSLMRNEDPARAVYVLSWAQALNGEPLSAAQRLVLQKAEDKVPETLVNEIMAKKGGHGIPDMDAFAARVPAPKPVTPGPPLKPADAGAVKAETAPPVVVSSAVTFKTGVKAELMDAPPGVVFHKDQGVLEWIKSPFSRSTEAKVLFLLTNPEGKEETLIHTISEN